MVSMGRRCLFKEASEVISTAQRNRRPAADAGSILRWPARGATAVGGITRAGDD
jgi:hypothetical protein